MELQLYEAALYFLLGVAAATIATMSGVGGGVFFVPILHLLLGYPIHLSVGTSKAIVAVVTGLGGLSYVRERLVAPRDAALVAASMIPSSALGAALVAYMNPRVIEVVVGAFVAFYGARLLYRSLRGSAGGGGAGSSDGGAGSAGRSAALKVTAGALAGLIAGLTGTGGGAILVPVLTSLLGMNLKRAVATSTLTIWPGSIIAAAVHAYTNTIDYAAWTLLAPGALIGALIGPRVVARARLSFIRPVVGLTLLAVGLTLALST